MNEPIVRPQVRPARPFFSSGPCAKHPGWTVSNLENAVLGRSHRSGEGKARLKAAIDKTHEILKLPDDYMVGIVPGSDTGAVEMSMWSLLGARGVDVLAWESFGLDWVRDVVDQLKLDNVRSLTADYGQLPDLGAVDFSRDVVFTWNGTTSGIRVPNAEWIPNDRDGLTICDATSAIFAHHMDWQKLDATTFSWQKVLGGEAAHGMLILSPRAVSRLESYTPDRPMPKLFRMTKGGKLNQGIFRGLTINTPSMLCLEDYLSALQWADSVGGLQGLIDRSSKNARAVDDWVKQSSWIDYLGGTAETRSHTSVCLKIVDPAIVSRSPSDQAAFSDLIVELLAAEGVGYDFGSYRDAPPGLRIWCGATVDEADVRALMQWLDWAYSTAKQAEVIAV